jgi:DNA (cytosine-5)-methyltransferase 1
MEITMLLLDLFSGAGGAAKGYMDAIFTVVGVDLIPQPRYVGNAFFQEDALAVLDLLLSGEDWHGYRLSDFAAIHASPVCKGYTGCNRPNQRSLIAKDDYPRLIPVLRERLVATGTPYIIENVAGAKKELRANLLLCGSMFGLPIQRHRLFEIGGTDLFVLPPRPCNHKGATIAVYGHPVWDSSKPGTPRRDGRPRPDSVPIVVGGQAMDISWMTKEELAQAIPPPYTQWIGAQLLNAHC